MGMSASQARFLCLTARKNNVEFEGQQINQQRTTLSNESYYSELCNMAVPIPPSIDDYTKVSYTFNDGAMTNTVTSLLYSKDDSSYHVNYVQQWQDDYSIVPAATSLVQVNGNGTYTIGDTLLRKIDGTTMPAAGTDPYYDSLDVNAKQDALKTELYYLALLRDSIDSNANFYVRYVKNTTTGNYEPFFYKEGELTAPNTATDRNLKSVAAYTLGTETKTKEVLNKKCDIEQDASGRYVAITIQIENNGKTESKRYTLNASTTTDEDAYNDAMNQYYYNQHEYDHKVQEINSKLEIIQQQDKQLELKLKQLDTEENAISTEMDAVKKVISKNVDSLFKTFSA